MSDEVAERLTALEHKNEELEIEVESLRNSLSTAEDEIRGLRSDVDDQGRTIDQLELDA